MKLPRVLVLPLFLAVSALGAHVARAVKGAVERGDLTLRVCNAVPSPGHLLHLSASFVGSDQDLTYRECKEYRVGRNAPVSIRFSLGNGAETSWPEKSFQCKDCRSVFLIAYRPLIAVGLAVNQFNVKGTEAEADSQVFFFDAYEGGGASPSLSLHPSLSTAVAGSVASIGLESLGHEALRPGRYEATVHGGRLARKAESTLIALRGESYLIFRVGMAGRQDGLPPELVVFPQSNTSRLPSRSEHSVAVHLSWSALRMVAVLYGIVHGLC